MSVLTQGAVSLLFGRITYFCPDENQGVCYTMKANLLYAVINVQT